MWDYKAEVSNYIDENWENAIKDRKEFFGKLISYKYICLFGAGGMGIDLAHYLTEIGIKIDSFSDNNSNLYGKEICLGIKCVSIKELLKHKDEIIILISTRYYKKIFHQLDYFDLYKIIMPTSLALKCKYYLDKIDCIQFKSNICQLFDILDDDKSKIVASTIIKKWFMPISKCYKHDYSEIKSEGQYFNPDIVLLTNEEVFIDGGAYDGDTIRDFINITNNQFRKIIAYELDKNCFIELEKNMKNMKKNIRSQIQLYNLGLYDQNQIINYSMNTTSSAINPLASEVGEVVKMDLHLKNEEITFIKMDIEGSEVKALQGGKQLIQRNKPTLAICIYHEPEHLWQIPLLIRSLVPEYKIFIRHHSETNVETVCYAVL